MRRRRRDRLIIGLVVGLCYMSALAWSGTVVARSAGQRPLTVVCSSIEDVCREWISLFEARSGRQVSMVRLSTGEALARITRAPHEFDVWHGGTADAYTLATQRGLLAPHIPPDAALVPRAYRDPDGSWTGVYLGILGFCSNRATLDRLGVGLPQTWEDLTDPRLAGHVSAPDPMTSGTGYTMIWTQQVRLGSQGAALAYLRRLDDNVLQYTRSGLAPAAIAARGEAAVAISFSQHCVKAQHEGARDLVISYPRDGTGFEVGGVAVLAGAHHGDQARDYVDFAVSREAQLAGTERGSGQLPTRTDLAVDPQLGGDAPRLAYSISQAAAARDRLTARFEAEVDR